MDDLQRADAAALGASLCSRREALGRLAALGGAAAAALVLPACGGGDGGDTGTAAPAERAAGLGVAAQEQAAPPIRTFKGGLQYPWGLAFLPDRSLLVTEKVGRLRLISPSGTMSTVSGLPGNLYVGGHGGLLDVAVRPEGSDLWVYFSYAERGSGDAYNRTGTAVARARLVGTTLRDRQVIFRANAKVPISTSIYHYGSRLAFAPDGRLFITLGERRVTSQRDKAQSLAYDHGKVVRINRDGSIPGDNPFVGVSGARPEIWSLGHRNPQGAAIHPGTGELWCHEHGPQGGDEVNIVRRGRNYGWPRISYGCEYGAPVGNCTPVGGATSRPGMEQPVTYWVPLSIAPSGMAFYSGDMFPDWRGSLFLGALAGTALWRLGLSGNSVVSRTSLYSGLGERIRDVRQGPDGALYLLTDSNSGRVLRISAT